ncbi:MAG: thioredoxin-disulfide reductase [Succinivibrio sp.]|jgi:thioredoxin reductase (NADPH)|nr:thioredoxin-disulfide reductase [Succinivibrio sp.]
MSEILNTLIIGSGPAGYTAAIYACRAQLEPVLVCGSEVGGQLTTTPEIENWPSRSDAPDGFSLMQDMSKHAEKLGTKFIFDEVVKTDFKNEIKEVYLSSGTVLKARTVIIATGAKARYLGLESETKYKGKGVSACATCDGFFFRGKEVAVVGGGSAAFIEALYLANLCSKVYLIHRRAEFRAEKVLVDRLKKLESEGKVEFVLNANVKEILGDGDLVNGVKVEVNGQNRDIHLSGVFMAIGHEPSTKPFAGQIELYDDGTVKTGFTSETSTSVPGVFAAGDCADRVYRQAITSAGQGCKAALDAEKYLQSKL